ncbi:hypothetical protein HYV84_01710 [Candidatus Woesearchaeota archaeon]|nr:hypothetical protein [Candidatus Woesearchaeota archaeon]
MGLKRIWVYRGSRDDLASGLRLVPAEMISALAPKYSELLGRFFGPLNTAARGAHQQIISSVYDPQYGAQVIRARESFLAASESILFKPLQEQGGNGADLEALAVGGECGAFGAELERPMQEVAFWKYAGVHHDLGKALVPKEILGEGKFSNPGQYEQMKLHPLYGAAIVNLAIQVAEQVGGPILVHPLLHFLRAAALLHHQRKNGNGYLDIELEDGQRRPLRDDQIPSFVYVLALSDAYVALRSRRSYKPPVTHEQAFEILRSGDRNSPDFFLTRSQPGTSLYGSKVWNIFEGKQDLFREIADNALSEAQKN